MRRALFSSMLLLGLAVSLPARAEDETLPVSATDTGTPPGFKPVRYLEDYTYLASKRALPLEDRIKYLPLWSGAYLSVGGQHRVRYELVDPVELGVGERHATSSALLSRNLLHLDVHLSPEFRLFGQLGGHYALGVPASAAKPPDADDADIMQLFAEARAKRGPLEIVTRVGRQEMPLSSTRWVSTRDGTNVRRAFDLVRSTVTVGERFHADVFLGTTPDLKRGSFDDAPAWQDGFWGAYTTTNLLPKQRLGVDLFWFGRRHRMKYESVAGREVRHTFGARVFGRTAFGLEYRQHAMMQVGELDGTPIVAWGLSSALWQDLPAGFRLGLRGDALSGDSNPKSGRLTTFDPIFPNQTFFSALPAIYPTNLYGVHPLIRFGTSKFEIEGGCVFFWRQAVADAIYAPPGRTLVTGATTSARYTGAQTSVSIAYKADRHLSFNTEYSHYFIGPALTESGGSRVDYVGTWTTYTY